VTPNSSIATYQSSKETTGFIPQQKVIADCLAKVVTKWKKQSRSLSSTGEYEETGSMGKEFRGDAAVGDEGSVQRTSSKKKLRDLNGPSQGGKVAAGSQPRPQK